MNEEEMQEYEGNLWVFVGGDGDVISLHTNEPTLKEMQKHVGGYIEYAHHKKGGVLPLPMSQSKARMSEVLSVIVDEEGLLKGHKENSIATWAAYQKPLTDKDTGGPWPYLVGPAIVKVKCASNDEIISQDEFFLLLAGRKVSAWQLVGMTHFADNGDDV